RSAGSLRYSSDDGRGAEGDEPRAEDPALSPSPGSREQEDQRRPEQQVHRGASQLDGRDGPFGRHQILVTILNADRSSSSRTQPRYAFWSAAMSSLTILRSASVTRLERTGSWSRIISSLGPEGRSASGRRSDR